MAAAQRASGQGAAQALPVAGAFARERRLLPAAVFEAERPGGALAVLGPVEPVSLQAVWVLQEQSARL